MRRVRWENVIRVAGAGLLVAVVVGWPRLAPPEPDLPAPEAAPLAGEEPPAVSPTVGEPPVRRLPANEKGGRRAMEPRRPATKDRRSTARERRAVERGRRAIGRDRDRQPRVRERRAITRERLTPVEAGEKQPVGGGPGPAASGEEAGSDDRPGPAPDPAQTEFGFEGR